MRGFEPTRFDLNSVLSIRCREFPASRNRTVRAMSQKATPLGALAAVVGGVIGYYAVNGVNFTSEFASADDSLAQVAGELNKSLPVQVDAETRLERIEAGPGREVLYRYTLVNYAIVPTLDAPYFVSVLRPRALGV